MHFRFSKLYRHIGITVFTWVLAPLIVGCVNEDLSDCPDGVYSVAFEYVNHTDAQHADRFSMDVQRIDLYVFDAAGIFVKCITREGTPFPGDFHLEPELAGGDYTLVAWGNLSDEVTIQPGFISGQTRLEEALLVLNTAEDKSISKKMRPVFHAIREVNVDDSTDKTDILSFTKNENQLGLTVKWFEKSGIPCIHRCAEGVRVRVVAPKGATYKFDNSVVASGNEIIYYPYEGAYNDVWNEWEGSFSLMRLVEGEKLPLIVERQMPDGTLKELYRTDLIELVRRHPYTRSQVDLDREDMYDIEISLVDDLDGDTDTFMQAAITVEGWKIILQDTGI